MKKRGRAASLRFTVEGGDASYGEEVGLKVGDVPGYDRGGVEGLSVALLEAAGEEPEVGLVGSVGFFSHFFPAARDLPAGHLQRECIPGLEGLSC